jgi:periplasmic divalent cation tolerance protein
VSMSSELIQIQWSAGSIDEARRVSRYLVQERIAALAEIIPWVESISMLNNQLETAQQSKVLFVTKREFFERVQEVILKQGRYEVPELSYTVFEGVDSRFLNWANEAITIPIGN